MHYFSEIDRLPIPIFAEPFKAEKLSLKANQLFAEQSQLLMNNGTSIPYSNIASNYYFGQNTAAPIFYMSAASSKEDLITSQISKIAFGTAPSLGVSFREIKNFRRRLARLLKDYLDERRIIDSFAGNSNADSDRRVCKAIEKVASLNSQFSSLEIRDEESLVFTVRLSQKRKFFLRYFPNENSQDKEGSFSYFEGKNFVSNGVGSFDDVITDVNNIIENPITQISLHFYSLGLAAEKPTLTNAISR